LATKTSKGRGYAVVGVTIAALLIASLLLYQAYSRGGNVSTSGSGSSTSSSTQSLGQQQVASRIGLFINDLANLNAQNLTGLYSSTAVLSWSGNGINSTSSPPLNWKGTYRGGNISDLYAMVMNYLQPPHPLSNLYNSPEAIMSDLATNVVSPNTVNATFRLFLSDYTSGYGTVTATVSISQQWINQGAANGVASGAWYINQDSWDFTASTIEYSNG